MARSRLVKIGACKNEVLAMQGPSMTLLFVMLPTLADREGRLEDRPLRIKAEIFPYGCLDNEGNEVDVNAMLQWLADCDEHFIERYCVDGKRYLQITNFHKHQSPHHKEAESEIPPSSMNGPCITHAQTMLEPSMSQVPKQVTSNKNKNKDKEGGTGGRFVPPSVEEVAVYCQERKNGIDAEAFIAHYAAAGWKRGKAQTPITNWKQCIITWEKKGREQPPPTQPKSKFEQAMEFRRQRDAAKNGQRTIQQALLPSDQPV